MVVIIVRILSILLLTAGTERSENQTYQVTTSPPIYACIFRVDSFFQAYKPKFCMHFSSPHAKCPANLVFLDLIILIVLVKSINCEVPHHTLFSGVLSLHSSSVQMFSSDTPNRPLYVFPLGWETHFHTRIKQKTTITSETFIFKFLDEDNSFF
jgi:hypothetical protein